MGPVETAWAMQLLVSFCNLRAPGLPALALVDSGTLAYRVVRLPKEVAPLGGITGLARCEGYIFAAAQVPGGARPSILLTFDAERLRLVAAYPFRLAADVHSLWSAGDALFAVSTGTDEVVRLSRRGPEFTDEEVFWRPEPTGTREDRHHLNGICVVGDELLVSAFGKSWQLARESARDGFVINATATADDWDCATPLAASHGRGSGLLRVAARRGSRRHPAERCAAGVRARIGGGGRQAPRGEQRRPPRVPSRGRPY
jgi:hypothetical protein